MATLGTSKKVAIVERLKKKSEGPPKKKMAVVERWPLGRGGVSGESTVTTSIFFLASRELKIVTNCTIKHSYTDWYQCRNTTEYRRLLCLPRQMCRFSKIAAQSQAIYLHVLG